ncbi:MAG: hydrogenase maturation protease HycI [Promethearchaeota archaeon CR_4]|nr:MAG: hydrogenase maturation protease HycI [Candidatus Lokiarchaeota archaeon CR_4]
MSLYSELKTRLVKGKVAVLGVGDVKMCDDGVGPYVVSTLHELLPPLNTVKLINGSTVPEMYREEIVAFQPTYLVIIDAAEMKSEPGTVKIVEKEHMRGFLPTSSHMLPMTLVVDWIQTALPDVDIFLLAIQPASINLVDDNLELVGDGEDFFNAVEDDSLKPFFRFIFTPKVDAGVKIVVETLSKLLKNLK